jgi:hypothetical protein
MDSWRPFEDGRSLGSLGSENGTILLDEEHADGARITIESGGRIAPFSITCGVYGWMVHTRFFSTESEARHACDEMKVGLAELLHRLDRSDLDEDEALKLGGGACADFVERFP